MIVNENHCVECEKEPQECYTCKYNNVEVHYCDECVDNEADYTISDWQYSERDMCQNCLEDYLREIFDELLYDSILECADMLDVEVSRY